ncbi:MAG: L,D-transpeptidase family protein [Thiohalomonadales bacterium]
MSSSQLKISIKDQRLQYYHAGKNIMDVKISTATNGPGESYGSECTPRGRHKVRAKVGENCVENAVFVARRFTGEVFSETMRQEFPNRDWILTRILWLSGLEVGKNRLGKVDTMRRYIYIHGCPDSDPMALASSHGCIKMRNPEVIELYDRIAVGTEVHIFEGGL